MSQSYKTGTVTVTAGQTSVVGSGTAWALALATGGLFCCQGVSIPCTVVDDTHLELDVAWPATSGAGKTYSIFRETAQAASAVLANDRLAEVADRLNKLSFINFDAMGILAQRAAYDTAQKDFIFLDIQADPFALYIKASGTAGDWAGPNQYGQGPEGPPGADSTVPGPAYNARGAYGGATAYAKYDVVLYQGSSYVAKQATTGNLPTDTTYWQLLAQKGTDGTGTGDVVGPAGVADNALVRFDTATGKKIKAGAAIQTAELGDAQVTLAKLANIATASLLGRATAATGVPEVLTAAQVKALLALAKADVSLGNVDNTSDANKPVSTAQQTALNGKLNTSGGTLTGALVLSGAPTNDLHAATKKYVDDRGGAVLTAVVPTTSGTAIDLTGIPATAKRVTLILMDITQSSSATFAMQLGTSAGVETTGYKGTVSSLTTTASVGQMSAGFFLTGPTGGTAVSGMFVFDLINPSTNTWVGSGWSGAGDGTRTGLGVGNKSLSGTIDRIRLTTTGGTITYTGGSVALLIE